MEDSRYPHVPAALSSKVNDGIDLIGRWVCPRGVLDVSEKNKTPCPLPGYCRSLYKFIFSSLRNFLHPKALNELLKLFHIRSLHYNVTMYSEGLRFKVRSTVQQCLFTYLMPFISCCRHLHQQYSLSRHDCFLPNSFHLLYCTLKKNDVINTIQRMREGR
jgi:hypothetical protein